MHQIEKMTAIAGDPPAAPRPGRLNSIPTNLDAANIVRTLADLGLAIPTSIRAAAAKGERLRAAGHKFGMKEIDGALSAANIPISDRFLLKTAMGRNGILEK